MSHHQDRSGYYWFRKVPNVEVSAETRQLASDFFKFVVADLNLGDVDPAMVWIGPTNWRTAALEHEAATGRYLRREPHARDYFPKRQDLSGFVSSESTREILIRCDLTAPQLKKTIAHELWHLYQKKARRSSRLIDEHVCEKDAYEYSDDAVSRYDGHRGPSQTT